MEKFSWSKLLSSFFQGLSWVKSISLGIRIIIILVAGFTIWKAYLKKPQPTQSQQFVIQDGGQAIVQQITKDKKNWYIFTEPYGFVEKDRNGFGVRAGVRWEF